MRQILAVLSCLLLSSTAFSQCENGQCRVPLWRPVAKAAQVVHNVHAVRSESRAVRSSAVSYGSVGSTVTSYGSTGYSQVANYGSTGTMAVRSATCTCVNCQCGQVANQALSNDSVSSLGFKSRKASREVILAAAKTACDECTITPAEFQAIRMAVKSPRMLARIEDMILAQAQASGAYSFALDANGDPIKTAINWEAIGDFILKIAPIIFKLIEMFAVMEQSGDVQSMAMIMENIDYLSSLHWQSQLAC